MNSLINNFQELQKIKNPPKELFYIGDTSLLKKRKISIVGTRKPNPYTKNMIYKIAQKLSSAGIVVVSGVALGVDAIAHQGAKNNTIAIVANGLDIRYPAYNKSLIKYIEENALIMSAYKQGEEARKYSFLDRNQIVVGLGEILIIGQADLRSGSIASANIAKKLNKQIYVLPHRLDESKGTNDLLLKKEAKAILDIDEFLNDLGLNDIQNIQNNNTSNNTTDKILKHIQSNSNLEQALLKFKDKIYEYELDKKIEIIANNVYIKS